MPVARSALFVASVLVWTVVTPAMSFEEFKAAHACRAMVADPLSALNLVRPFALRYRTAPIRVCVPDDTNEYTAVARA